MEESNSTFSKELTNLISARSKTLSIVIFAILALSGIIIYAFVKAPRINNLLAICVLFLVIVPFVLVKKYARSVTKTVFHVIADDFGWQVCDNDLQVSNINDSYQDYVLEFGLLSSSGYVKFNNALKGEINNYKFILQDISWMIPKQTKNGGRIDKTSAKYSLLMIDNIFGVNCDIVIKKNTMLKWGVRELKRITIDNKEFEKYYDVYTDDPGAAISALNWEFLFYLLSYKQSHKDLAEILITPKYIFIHQKSIEKDGPSGYNIFTSPMKLCLKKEEKINAKLDILQALDLLNKK